jgi:hypothetical protein
MRVLVAILASVVSFAAVAGPIETLVETGEVALALRADRSSLTTAETLTLRLEATVPAGGRAYWPELGETLGPFTIVDGLGLPPRRAADGRRTLTRVYTLAPFLPGAYEIPALGVDFELESEARFTLRSQPIRIEVTTTLDEEPEELSVGELAGPAALPEEPGPLDLWPWFASAAGAAIVAAAGAAVLIQRRARMERPAEDPIRSARVGLAALASKATGDAPTPWRLTISRGQRWRACWARGQRG